MWVRRGRLGTVVMLTNVAVVAGGLSVVGAFGKAATGNGAAAQCSEVRVPVSVPGGSGPIAGTLCEPPGATTVQLLVPGYSYGRYYWALPQLAETYWSSSPGTATARSWRFSRRAATTTSTR